ncbi:MAG: recombination protein RecR [Spirochaetes bacterium]|uniref:Recombination protein RecR n=1 Tax=Candidatus Ornithospirochaeta stercoravium TaxID=2840897 RepID=A0A9D9NE70_9SPIO|nr:recombination protein RecR [Candidatus Ornithospirochaeta stercoravium]
MDAIETLQNLLKRLPGMGEKSAARLCYHLIRTDDSYNKALAEAISQLKEKIHPCPICGCYTEEEKCRYCTDTERDQTTLCIVEEPQDVLSIASSGAYNGLFHVLGGAINPLGGVGPENLSFPLLMKRINEGNFREIIIATNPTEEGDTTALYIRHLLKDKPEITLTRLASGLPIGGDLGYADKLTLARSMRGRIRL